MLSQNRVFRVRYSLQRTRNMGGHKFSPAASYEKRKKGLMDLATWEQMEIERARENVWINDELMDAAITASMLILERDQDDGGQ